MKKSDFRIISILSYAWLFSIVFFSCKRNSSQINTIGNLQKKDSSIMVRNWLLKGPYFDTGDTFAKQGAQILNSKLGEEGEFFNYYQDKDYIPLDVIFKTNALGSASHKRLGGICPVL